jgi:hypothetical protein
VSDFPRVDRTLKGDRLVTVTPDRLRRRPPGRRPGKIHRLESSVKGAKPPIPMPSLQNSIGTRGRAERAPLAIRCCDVAEAQPLDELKAPSAVAVEPRRRDSFSFKTSSLFFGSSSLGSAESIERWQPGEEPMIVLPGGLPDPDLKVTASLPAPADEPSKTAERGESIAAKGEVNADNQRAKTPAERLGLFDERRAPNRKSVCRAVYFEARGGAQPNRVARL